MEKQNLTCRVCGVAEGHAVHRVPEMMFATGESFDYFECADCETLQIVTVPADLAPYYPTDYLGLPSAVPMVVPTGRARAFLRAQRASYAVGQPNMLGRWVSKAGPSYFPYPWEWFRQAGVGPKSAILDIGCGPGLLLAALRTQGFSKAVGQDKFQRWTIPGVSVTDTSLEQLHGLYDLVMLHHSFEHMPDPRSAMQQLARLCAPRGTVLIRIPVANCRAWKVYGTHWYQIDAPRHLVIPSPLGVTILAEQAGLEVFNVTFDSTPDQFACSEQYRQGIALRDQRSAFQRRNSPLFSATQYGDFELRTKQANVSGQGDQACFYLRHT